MKPTPKTFGSRFLLLFISTFILLSFFQNCGNVSLNSASTLRPGTSLPNSSNDQNEDNDDSEPQQPPAPVTNDNLDPAFINCNRSWKKVLNDVPAGSHLRYYNDFIYMSRITNGVPSYDKVNLTTKVVTPGPALRYNNDPCSGINDAFIDETNMKAYVSATCALTGQGNWHIIFELNLNTLAIEKSIFPGQLVWNFAQAANGDILGSSMYWNAAQQKYCAELLVRTPGGWNKFGTYRCDVPMGQLIINSKNEFFIVDSSNSKKILNYLTGETFAIPTQYLTVISDFRGDLIFAGRDFSHYMTEFYRFNRKDKTFSPLGTHRDDYLGEVISTYGDNYLIYGATPELSNSMMQKTSDFSSWTEWFKSMGQYTSVLHGVEPTYMSKSGFVARPRGDLYISGTVIWGSVQRGELWQYTCN